VLEHLGNAPARRVMETLAGGAAGDVLTREAQQALQRLRSRSAKTP
jgi:hypothetical protein